VQELKAIPILLKYGDYLHEKWVEFKGMILGESSWDGQFVTTIWQEYLDQEEAYKK
jgi:hypothetical protein